MARRQPSLARRMTLAFFAAYAAILFVALLLFRIPALAVDESNHLGPDVALALASSSIVRTERGGLQLAPTPALSALAERAPALWLIASDGRHQAIFGPVPPQARSLVTALPDALQIGEIRLPGIPRPLADVTIDTIDTPAGLVRLIAGGVDPAAIGWGDWLLYVWRVYMIVVVPLFAVLAVPAVMLVVPLVLRGLRPLVRAAEEVDASRPERRLPETTMKELLPIVRAFNAALDRLSDAFERRRRFIADVAHELRTPLAVLNMHVESLPGGGAKPDLQRGVYRLGQMIGQMLDAERLTLAARRREPVDLVELVRAGVADIAPLAVAGGYDIAVSTEADALIVDADRHALARALGNLLGNAVAHGGGAGLIEARVRAGLSIEVSDHGPGVPLEARDRIFEPFRRERWDRDGCGLGLHLVREIMTAHGGKAELVPSSSGATFRLVFAQPTG